MLGDPTHIFKLFGFWEFYKKTLPPAPICGSRAANLDFQLSYTVPRGGKFQGIIEARVINVFDAQTVMGIDTWAEQPTFKNPLSYASPWNFALTFYVNF